MGKDEMELFQIFFNYPKVTNMKKFIGLAIKIKNTFEGKLKLLSELEISRLNGLAFKESLKHSENSGISFFKFFNKDIETSFQRQFPKIPSSYRLDKRNPTDRKIQNKIEEIELLRDSTIIERLTTIKNKYKSKFSREDLSDFNFLLEKLKEKLH